MKELITELINRLVSEASSDASHMSYCGDELAKILSEERGPSNLGGDAAVAKSSVLDGKVAGCRRILVLFQHSN